MFASPLTPSGSLQALMAHCDGWVSKFTNLLLSIAAAELRSLHQYFATAREQLAVHPASLDQLAEVTLDPELS